MPRRWQYPAHAEPVLVPPPASPVAWLPSAPDYLPRVPSSAHRTDGAYVRVPTAVSPLSWLPRLPDLNYRLPSRAWMTDGGFVRVPSAPPPLTWRYIDPVYPDRSRRLTAALIDTSNGVLVIPSSVVPPPAAGDKDVIYAQMMAAPALSVFAHPVGGGGLRGFGVRGGFSGVPSGEDDLATLVLPPEVPTGTVDGNNVTFTLANSPAAAALALFKNGVLQQANGVDFTLSGNTITMASAPQVGDELQAIYRY